MLVDEFVDDVVEVLTDEVVEELVVDEFDACCLTELTVIVPVPSTFAPVESATFAVNLNWPTSFASMGSTNDTELPGSELVVCAPNSTLPVSELLIRKLYEYGGTPPVTLTVSCSVWFCVAVELEALAETSESDGALTVVVDAVVEVDDVDAEEVDVEAALVVCVVVLMVVFAASEIIENATMPQSDRTTRNAASSWCCMLSVLHAKLLKTRRMAKPHCLVRKCHLSSSFCLTPCARLLPPAAH